MKGSPAPAPDGHRCAGLALDSDLALAGMGDSFTTRGRLAVGWEECGDGTGWLRPPLGHPARLRADGRRARLAPLSTPAARGALVRRLVPYASWLQGRGVLHAAAAEGEGGVVVLAGPSGIGKSTLSRALVGRGAHPVADDLLPFEARGRRVRIPRAGGELKLVAMVFLERAVRYHQPSLVPLDRQDAFAELTRNGWGDLEHPALWTRQFELHTRLAVAVPTLRLRLPDDPAAVDGAAECIETLWRSGKT